MRNTVRAADVARTCGAVGARRSAADLSTSYVARGDDSDVVAFPAVGAVARSGRPKSEIIGEVDDDGKVEHDNPFASARAQQAQPLAQNQQLGVAPAEFLLAIGLGLARGP